MATRSVRKSLTAERDLLEIWVHSHGQWGEAQADRYLEAIDAALAKLCEHPALGSDLGEHFAGYRRFSVGRHRLFYRILPDAIYLVRVLHAQMDATSRLLVEEA